jgi:hypothetical protein
VIPDPPSNTCAFPYRGLSVQEVDVPLTPDGVASHLLGREAYRRTDWLLLRNGTASALVAVRKESTEPLFSPVTEVRLLAAPGELVEVVSPETDVGNRTALAAAAALHRRAGVSAYVVTGRYQHVNFLWRPAPVQVRVTEVVPPFPAKLLAMAQQAVAFDEDLPPVDLVLDAVDLRVLAGEHPADVHLLPCRGAGVDVPGQVAYLDTRPAQRRDWLMLGCERSLQFHRHFYGDEPPRADICPRRRAGDGLTLTKCCLIERGLEFDGDVAVVPWGANLDEVRRALRLLTGVTGSEVGRQLQAVP